MENKKKNENQGRCTFFHKKIEGEGGLKRVATIQEIHESSEPDQPSLPQLHRGLCRP
jgi:hypothetical protein